VVRVGGAYLDLARKIKCRNTNGLMTHSPAARKYPLVEPVL
jgi:hypothetical protein